MSHPKRFKTSLLDKAHSYDVIRAFSDYRIIFHIESSGGYLEHTRSVQYNYTFCPSSDPKKIEEGQKASMPDKAFVDDIAWLEENFHKYSAPFIKPRSLKFLSVAKSKSFWSFLFNEVKDKTPKEETPQDGEVSEEGDKI